MSNQVQKLSYTQRPNPKYVPSIWNEGSEPEPARPYMVTEIFNPKRIGNDFVSKCKYDIKKLRACTNWEYVLDVPNHNRTDKICRCEHPFISFVCSRSRGYYFLLFQRENWILIVSWEERRSIPAGPIHETSAVLATPTTCLILHKHTLKMWKLKWFVYINCVRFL